MKELDAGRWFGPDFTGQHVPTFDEVLDLVKRCARVSPAMALDLKSPPPQVIDMICQALEKYELTDEVVGIGSIIWSADIRRQFSERSHGFPSAAVAQTRDQVAAALEDTHSRWVYGRFVPTTTDVQRINQAGKRLFVSGDEVSRDVNRAYDAYTAGPDVVLTWHPSRLAQLTGV